MINDGQLLELLFVIVRLVNSRRLLGINLWQVKTHFVQIHTFGKRVMFSLAISSIWHLILEPSPIDKGLN